jgi:DNA-directed RNA polymerase omega subunit
MEKLEKENKIDQNIASRYTIVITAAKRARAIIDGAASYTKGDKDKAVSFAVKEMFEGRIKMTEGSVRVRNENVALVEETFVVDYNK